MPGPRRFRPAVVAAAGFSACLLGEELRHCFWKCALLWHPRWELAQHDQHVPSALAPSRCWCRAPILPARASQHPQALLQPRSSLCPLSVSPCWARWSADKSSRALLCSTGAACFAADQNNPTACLTLLLPRGASPCWGHPVAPTRAMLVRLRAGEPKCCWRRRDARAVCQERAPACTETAIKPPQAVRIPQAWCCCSQSSGCTGW